MTAFRFASCDSRIAKNFLNHEKYSYLSNSQKEFIIKNLCVGSIDDFGKYTVNENGFRVLDPEFHNVGVTTENINLLIQLEDMSETEFNERMFSYAYLSQNFGLVKWAVENKYKGEEVKKWHFERIIKRFNEEEIDYLISKNIICEEDIRTCMSNAGHEEIIAFTKKLKSSKFRHIKPEVFLISTHEPDLVELYYAGVIDRNHYRVDSSVKRLIKDEENVGRFRYDIQDKIISDFISFISPANERSFHSFKALTKLNKVKSSNSFYFQHGSRSLENLIKLIEGCPKSDERDELLKKLKKNSKTSLEA